ncbi:MAG: anaerobic sulfite reductase subunit A [Eubacteriaceae bacterium]|jgi:anaerobic sulfite reductase subunit A|nr:anaerobic sulfite reductase subunit A [Eubacteriaceae bacterium]
MGYTLSKEQFETLVNRLSEQYQVFAPVKFVGGNTFTDVDVIRYDQVKNPEEIVLDQKSDYSFKEVLLPLSETLFYYTEEQTKEADIPRGEAVVFLRSCEMHAVKVLDDIYLNNKFEDYYYKRLRDKIKFIVIACPESFDSCFCVDMGTNKPEGQDMIIEQQGDQFLVVNENPQWEAYFEGYAKVDQAPSYAKENKVKVHIPENLNPNIAKSSIWEEYDTRCIACGRCNFVCPTCTCFTMQDILYSDNGKAGERRRVQASCMVDGFTDVAGGGSYRKKFGERMRFKMMHKVYDFRKRFGYNMCVGCGRCDDVCPEYISFSANINKLEEGMKEVGEEHA